MNHIREVPLIEGGAVLSFIARQQIELVGELADAVSAVVVVADDQLSRQECGEIARLAQRGCRMFAFVGQHAELSHDCLDDALQQAPDDVSMTTYHVEESNEDVASMLLIYVRDKDPQRILFIDGSPELSAKLVSAFESVAQESS